MNQDPLGRAATRVWDSGDKVRSSAPPTAPASRASNSRLQVWAKQLDDGSRAVGLFNLGDAEQTVTASFADLKLTGKQTVRDLWRQKDLATVENQVRSPRPPARRRAREADAGQLNAEDIHAPRFPHRHPLTRLHRRSQCRHPRRQAEARHHRRQAEPPAADARVPRRLAAASEVPRRTSPASPSRSTRWAG